MGYALAVLCYVVMLLSLILLFIGLPGNWVIVIITAAWTFFTDSPAMNWQVMLVMLVLALAGEVAEFLAGHFGTKRFGGTSKGSLGGIIGGLVGGILCAPIFFGLGALLGALAGGFIGCFLFEKMYGMGMGGSAKSALGATIGRFGGFIMKLAVGVTLICLSAPRIWESI